MKLRIMRLLDFLDVHLVRHRWPALCDWLCMHPWWGDHDCRKAGCTYRRFK